MTTPLALRDVAVRFGESRKPAVAGVTLALEEGEIFGIVGESGSGKSTLGRLMLGLLAPTGGSVTFNKGDINTINLFDYGNGDAGNSGTPPATYLRNIWSASWDSGSQTFTAFTLAVDG